MVLRKSSGVALLAVLGLIIGSLAWFPAPAQADNDFFSSDSYALGDTVTLNIDDNAMNITTGPDIVVNGGHLYSSTDMTGIYVDLTETGDSTGIFTATATVTRPGDTGAGKIPCAPGDTLAANYTDGSSSGSDTATIKTPVLTWSGTTFTEAAADNGSISNSLTLTLANDSFTVPGGVMTSGVHYEAANVPAGLTLVITGTSSTTATVQLTGNASSHAAANSITNMRITFKDAAFAWGESANVTGYTQSSLAVTFTSTLTPPTFVAAETNGNGTVIYATFSKAMASPSGRQAQFTVNDGAANTVSSIAFKSGYTNIYALTLSRSIDESDTVTLAYTAGDVTAADGSVLATFTARTVNNLVDSDPSSTYSGITDTDKGDEGSNEVEIEITVKNSSQAGLEGYEEDDFEVVIDNDNQYLDFNDSEFGDFDDQGAGIYTVTFYGDEPDTTYKFDLWVDGVKIENDYRVTTPDDDDDDEDDDNGRTYTISSREKEIKFHDLQIYIPEDAWDYSDTEIELSYSSSHSNSTLDNDQKFASDVYYITKDRSGYFDRDVTLTIAFDDYNIDEDEYTVSIYWYNSSSGEWEELDDVDVNWYTEECSGDTDHFTKFALIAEEIDGSHTSNNNNNTTASDHDIWTGPSANSDTGTSLIWDISGHWAEASIRALIDAGIVKGEPDGSFRPAQLVTRAEFCVFLARAFNLSGSGTLNFVDTRNHWARGYIATAVENGVMQGYSSEYFGPDDYISREQMAAAITNTIVLSSPGNGLDFRDAGDISPWAYSAVAACTAAGIITGDQNGYFHPQDYASKAEAATIIYRAWQ